MLLTAAFALTSTVALTGFAASRGRSPVGWGGASALITVAASALAWVLVHELGRSDLVFSARGAGIGMLSALAGPALALVGNGVLFTKLAALPRVHAQAGSSWVMWRVGEGDDEGHHCRLELLDDELRGGTAELPSFAIPYAQLDAPAVSGETLIIRSRDGARIRLLLAAADPEHRSATIRELERIVQAIEARRRTAS